jgi:hypothetical protein
MIPAAVVTATFEYYAVITYQKRSIDKVQGSEIQGLGWQGFSRQGATLRAANLRLV